MSAFEAVGLIIAISIAAYVFAGPCLFATFFLLATLTTIFPGDRRF